ncbi:ABC transporter permease [Listeria sp. SHR_NRA_18]|uniref:FtsX-like permease family protein n=1 Tax=Listeria sp. SHR_NRA_18 TaxID=2269046 RepID=UPI00051D2790|nr:ABC transporter permease [Listeria sp. SHR_NRA_18]KGL39051.1 ABC transporter permease [Listeriaceae bacterium FSL A5-0209]RQW66271.1 ABC transporter permease [Listeria sp. SHR_NRA_18]
MTLFDLAKKNIKHNFVHYFLYFASMSFSIMIYYTFVSLAKDPAVVARIDKSAKLSAVFNASSIVLIIFVAIFILYSNHFFTRKRKKEIGLYSLLGLRKKEIGRMLFYENFLMGVVALVIGIGLGTLLSKLFVTILLQVMNFGGVSNFVFSMDAVINTVIIFIIITLITSVSGYRIIYSTTLLDLFHSESKREKTPKNNPILAILSVILIGGGYFLALQPLNETSLLAKMGPGPGMLTILFSVIIGTALLLSNFLPFLLNQIRKNKRIFYKGTNIISNSQLAFRIGSNARTLAIIAILSATTLTAIGAIGSIYYNVNKESANSFPSTFEYTVVDQKSNQEALKLAETSTKTPMTGHQETALNHIKATSDREMPMEYDPESGFTFISQTAYNKLLALQNNTEATKADLNNDEAILIAPGSLFDEKTTKMLENQNFILENSTKQKITLTETIKSSPIASLYALLIISDDVAKTISTQKTQTIQSIMVDNPKDAIPLSEQIDKALPENANFISYPTNYENAMSISGVLLFIGMFIGLVFLAATGSIIYFKQLTEAYNDVATYDILKKIGLDRKEIRKTIAKQVLVIFLIPLVLGIAHSSVALSMLSNMLQMDLTLPVLISTGIYTAMFIIYYFLTVNTYTNIVMGKKK